MNYDLDRFVAAQNPVYADVLAELRGGKKIGHWMWYIFPQFAGLGRSDMSRFYAIRSRDEASGFAEHSLLGPRLRECTSLVLGSSAHFLPEIFGSIDAVKFRSSMTLFALVTDDNAIFYEALNRFCAGRLDHVTTRLLAGAGAK
jgi:uncharacterized protein (DUF1810 family)